MKFNAKILRLASIFGLCADPEVEALKEELQRTRSALHFKRGSIDPEDQTVPEFIRSITKRVSVQDTGRDGERLFSVNRGEALLCAEYPENYKNGNPLGSTTIGYTHIDGTFVTDFGSKNHILIIFSKNHTKENPSYEVYKNSEGQVKNRYNIVGQYENGQYRDIAPCLELRLPDIS